MVHKGRFNSVKPKFSITIESKFKKIRPPAKRISTIPIARPTLLPLLSLHRPSDTQTSSAFRPLKLRFFYFYRLVSFCFSNFSFFLYFFGCGFCSICNITSIAFYLFSSFLNLTFYIFKSCFQGYFDIL